MAIITPQTWKALLSVPRWDLIAMLAMFAAIAALEFVGVINAQFVTITGIIRASIPRQFRWMILGWLNYHFGIE